MGKTIFYSIEEMIDAIDLSHKMMPIHRKIYYFFVHRINEIRGYFDGIKYAYQRVVRGYDDTAIWDLPNFLSNILPPILSKLKGRKYGVPVYVFEQSNDDFESALEKYDMILDKIIAAFNVHQELEELTPENFDSEYPRLIAIRNEGLDLFKEYFDDLWQ